MGRQQLGPLAQHVVLGLQHIGADREPDLVALDGPLQLAQRALQAGLAHVDRLAGGHRLEKRVHHVALQPAHLVVKLVVGQGYIVGGDEPRDAVDIFPRAPRKGPGIAQPVARVVGRGDFKFFVGADDAVTRAAHVVAEREAVAVLPGNRRTQAQAVGLAAGKAAARLGRCAAGGPARVAEVGVQAGIKYVICLVDAVVPFLDRQLLALNAEVAGRRQLEDLLEGQQHRAVLGQGLYPQLVHGMLPGGRRVTCSPVLGCDLIAGVQCDLPRRHLQGLD